jgi:hypothetical protein
MTKPARFCSVDLCTRDAATDGLCTIHDAAQRFPAIARTLTAEESAQRRSERASSRGPTIVTLCSWSGCPRAASHGPWCGEHRPVRPAPAEPPLAVAHDLTREDIAALRAQVEADAAPIFVIAMSWIARQQIAHLGVTADSLEESIDRIRAELPPDRTAALGRLRDNPQRRDLAERIQAAARGQR